MTLPTHPVARYVKVSVKEAVGNFGSGREFYVFKVPGTKTILPGDINLDGKVDENDFTSYMNYTGLKKGRCRLRWLYLWWRHQRQRSH